MPESPESRIDPERVLFGNEFNSLGEAVLADLVSAVPIAGAVTDYIRSVNADTRRKRALQVIDLVADPFPVINLLTPTNALLYLDQTGQIDLKFVDEAITAISKFRR